MASSTRKLRLPVIDDGRKPQTSVRVSDDVVDLISEIRCRLILWFSQNAKARPEEFDGTLIANDVLRYSLSIFCHDYGIKINPDPKGAA